jgi:TetR/AcrR family transcriptional repressor of nem operon
MPQTLNSTYEELIEKAQALFWLKGYKGVSVQDLSTHLKVSKSIIYNKYGKDLLFLDSLEYYTTTYSDPFLKQLRETTGGKESLRDFFYKLIDALLYKTFPKSCLMVNTVVEIRNENKDVILKYNRYFEALLNSYKVVLDKAIANGQIIYPEKKEQYAEFLLGVIFSLAILYKIKDKESLYAYVDEQISLIQ